MHIGDEKTRGERPQPKHDGRDEKIAALEQQVETLTQLLIRKQNWKKTQILRTPMQKDHEKCQRKPISLDKTGKEDTWKMIIVTVKRWAF